MSQEINNREYRQKVIKSLLAQLHEGKSADEVKEQFEKAFRGVSAAEISEAEQALINGRLPVEEVQKLCDVHAAVFKGSIEEIHLPEDASKQPGHPVHTFMQENRALETLIEDTIRPQLQAFQQDPASARDALLKGLKLLSQLDVHYIKKENLLFPYMEQYGITAPPKVMWGVDDEIRGMIKSAIAAVSVHETPPHAVKARVEEAVLKVAEMIFKEENILFPMLLETLTQQEWKKIAEESGDLGYFLIPAPPAWASAQESHALPEREALPVADTVTLPTGILKVKELSRLLDALPIDITFVDKDDTVRYFSQGAERVFPRTKAIIGRKVINCHPPASMHIVEKILEDFKAGEKDSEDFWIKMGDKYILIRYFAVRGENGAYLGTLEVTQNIAPIQKITGEKRLLSDA